MDVLIVEDARDQLHLLAAIVRKLGHHVHKATDGLQALAILQKTPSVRIVISDWMMPNMDGLNLCRAIRDGRFERYIYFILLTGKADHGALLEGLSVGADDFLHKPVDFRELAVRLKGGERVTVLEQTLEQKNIELSNALSTVEKDLESAAAAQQSLLSQPAVIQGVGFDWHFQPSKILGGDMFGYHAVDDENVMFYQLDVAGHGIPSALFSFALNNILMDTDRHSTILLEESASSSGHRLLQPHEVVAKLNSRFQTTADSMLYFTMIYGLIHSPSGRVVMTHAGHPSTFYLAANGAEVDILTENSFPVGMLPAMSWQTRELWMKPGDRLFMYSDGLVECENQEGQQYGEQALATMVHKALNRDMRGMITEVWETLCTWRGSDSFDDDMTCLALEYQGGE